MQAKRFLVFAIALFCAIGFAGVINQQDASAAKKTIKAKQVTLSSYTYTVKPISDESLAKQKPSVKVKYNKKVLKNGKDYTVTYSNKNSRHAGTYSVTGELLVIEIPSFG